MGNYAKWTFVHCIKPRLRAGDKILTLSDESRDKEDGSRLENRIDCPRSPVAFRCTIHGLRIGWTAS